MSVLVAVSDDNQYETVLDVAVQLAAGLDQQLVVTHITDTDSATGDERAFRTDLQSYLSNVDVPVEVSLDHLDRGGFREGTAVGKQLLELAERVDIDHIVLGYRSKDLLRTLREGHTGFTVAQEAAVPVTIVPEGVD
jgi:nucleotide-binding universal stress UspA family protein